MTTQNSRPWLFGNQHAKGKHHKLAEITKQRIAKSKCKGSFINCSYCSKPKWFRPYLIKRNKRYFCSKNCTYKFFSGDRATCVGKVYTAEERLKASLRQRGNLGSGWKGGVTKLQKLIRNSLKYRQWRSDIFTRDEFHCQWCTSTTRDINADHIIPFSVLLQKHEITTLEGALECEELWNLNNGRTLCFECHKTTSSYGNNCLRSFQLDLI